ncbi:MAG: hypothetical protein EHM83_04510 [Burkholderiales bacterium]|nr:MAG: hypothetical protein EHM83_04510 [Burkholderiales bacterium]
MEREVAMTVRPLRRLLLIGLLTSAPLVVTWLVLDFLLAQLSRAGAPWLLALSRALRTPLPGVADWLLESQAQSLMAAAPNPTSGYIEIVPLANVTQTDWSVDEAMAFVMTAGATGSGDLTFRGGGSPLRG